IVIEGEAGAGKSALLEALAVRLALRQHDPGEGPRACVIRIDGAADEASGGVALEIARRLLAEPRAGVLPELAPGVRAVTEGAGAAPKDADLGALVEAAVAWQRLIATRVGP